jgi:hypothetical protein
MPSQPGVVDPHRKKRLYVARQCPPPKNQALPARSNSSKARTLLGFASAAKANGNKR